MSKKAKLIISTVGISAVVVPALLLIFLTGKTPLSAVTNSADNREIDTKALEDTVKNNKPTPSPAPVVASPSPTVTPVPAASPKASVSPNESTGSAQ